MQIILSIILILLSLFSQAQRCPKFEVAMKDGKKYLLQKNYDKALVEFQAAQVAARECGISSNEPATELDKVFKGLQQQRDNALTLQKKAENARREAVEAQKIAEREKLVSKRTLGYFFKSDSAKVAWGLDLITGKYGVIDRNGEIRGGFVWESTTPFNSEFATAKRNDTAYFVNSRGNLISKGYEEIVNTEFPLYYYGAFANGRELIFFNGNKFETLTPNLFDTYLKNPRLSIFPFRVGGKFCFVDKKNSYFFPPIYSEIKIPSDVQQYTIMAASKKEGRWDLIDLSNSKLLASSLSQTQLSHYKNVEVVENFIDTLNDTLSWRTIFDKSDTLKIDKINSELNTTTDTHIDDTVTIETKYEQLKEEYNEILGDYLRVDSLINQTDPLLRKHADSIIKVKEENGSFFSDESYNHYKTFERDTLQAEDDTVSIHYRYNSLLNSYDTLSDKYRNRKSYLTSIEEIVYKTESENSIESKYPSFGEDTSSLNVLRFKNIKTENGIGIVNYKNEIILPPIYDIVRFYVGDSIFFIGKREITKTDSNLCQGGYISKYDTSFICQLFNASSGLFFGFESSTKDLEEYFWNGILFKDPLNNKTSSGDNLPKNDYSFFYMPDHNKFIPAINLNPIPINILNRETGIVSSKRFENETSFLYIKGNIVNYRNNIDSLVYNGGGMDGIFKNESYSTEKKGLMRVDGTVLTPPIFDLIDYPSEGKRVAKLNGRYGFIDSSGWHLPFDFDNAFSFEDGRACVAKNGKYGFIDNKGKEIISFSYEAPLKYGEEYHGLIGAKKGGKWGFINEDGKWIIDPIYDSVNGCAAVKKNEVWGYINGKNEILHPFDLEEARVPQTNGWARVKKNGKWGFFNAVNLRSIGAIYDSVNAFNGNYAWAKRGDYWMILDTLGREIYNKKDIEEISELGKRFNWIRTNEGDIGLIDSTGNQIVPFNIKNVIYDYNDLGKIYITKDSMDFAILLNINTGIKNRSKKIDPFKRLSFHNGLAIDYDKIENRDREILLEGSDYNPKLIAYRTFELGYKNKKGYAAFTDYGTGLDDTSKPIKLKRFLPLQYEEIGFPLNEEFMPVKKNGKWGFIQWLPQIDDSEKPKLAIPCKYDAVVPFIREGDRKIGVVSLKGQIYFINEKGEALLQ
jgi:hypothetical protein